MLTKPTIIKEKVDKAETEATDTESTPKETKKIQSQPKMQPSKKPKIEKIEQKGSIDGRNKEELIKRNQERIKELEALQKKSKEQNMH